MCSPAPAWGDYGGNVIHSHGGALALNVGGLVSGGVGFGHHNTLLTRRLHALSPA